MNEGAGKLSMNVVHNLSYFSLLYKKKWNEMFDGRDEFCPLADSSGTWYWPDFNVRSFH